MFYSSIFRALTCFNILRTKKNHIFKQISLQISHPNINLELLKKLHEYFQVF